MSNGGLAGKFKEWQQQNRNQTGGRTVRATGSVPTTTTMTPRPHPVGLRNITFDEGNGRVSFELKTVIHFWWMVTPAIVGVVGLLCVFFLSPVLAVAFANWPNPPRFFLWFTIIAIVSIAAFVFAIIKTRPWITIEGTKDEITVRNESHTMRFDRKHFGGMQVGYQIQTDSGALVSNLTEPRFGLTLLRLVYGPWGEDLPYMINSYHANELVIWMNMALGSVDAKPPKAHAPELGIVEEVF